MMEYEACGVF